MISGGAHSNDGSAISCNSNSAASQNDPLMTLAIAAPSLNDKPAETEEIKIPLRAKAIYFGTFCTIPYKEGLQILDNCLLLTVKAGSYYHVDGGDTANSHTVDRPCAFKIGWHNVVRFEYFSGPTDTTVFLTMRESCAQRIRETFGFDNEHFARNLRLPYYDTQSPTAGRRYLILAIQETSFAWLEIMRRLLNKVCEKYAVEITFKSLGEPEFKRLASEFRATMTILTPAEACSNPTAYCSLASIQPPPTVTPNTGVTQPQTSHSSANTVATSNAGYCIPTAYCSSAGYCSSATNTIVAASYCRPPLSARKVCTFSVGDALKRIMEDNDQSARSAAPSGQSNSLATPLGQSAIGAVELANKAQCNNNNNGYTVGHKLVALTGAGGKRLLNNIVLRIRKRFKDSSTTTTPSQTAPSPAMTSYASASNQNATPTNQNAAPSNQDAALASETKYSNFELIYPTSGADGKAPGDTVSLGPADMACLEPDAFLNDNIIDFYLKYIVRELVPEDKRNGIYVFNSFFYSRLTSRASSFNPGVQDQPSSDLTNSESLRDPKIDRRIRSMARHRVVKSWTKNVDIFDKDFVVIPINENAHWYLALICYPGLFGPVHEPLPDPSSPLVALSPDPSPSATVCPQSAATVNSILTAASLNIAATISDPFDPEDDEDDVEEALEERQQLLQDQSQVESSTLQRISKAPCIVIMDSLSCGTPRYKTVRILRDYLTEEYVSKKIKSKEGLNSDLVYGNNPFDRSVCRGIYPKVPQQDNYSDCGLYVLQYAESFLTRPPQDFGSAGLSEYWQHFFTDDCVRKKRTQILQLLLNFGREYAEKTAKSE